MIKLTNKQHTKMRKQAVAEILENRRDFKEQNCPMAQAYNQIKKEVMEILIQKKVIVA